jgi:hypothetical protein
MIVSTTIKNIKFEDDLFILETDHGNYSCKIIKGSVMCSIETLDKKTVPLSYLENNDLVKLKLKDNNIEKIYINTKYDIISDCSSEDYIS